MPVRSVLGVFWVGDAIRVDGESPALPEVDVSECFVQSREVGFRRLSGCKFAVAESGDEMKTRRGTNDRDVWVGVAGGYRV